MAEKNSLWKNIRKKAEQNRRTGAKPKKPTAEMLRQERKIKAKQYSDGGPVNTLEGDLISKIIMNRNRDKDFVQRAYAVGEYPESNMFVQPDVNEFGQKNSHLMAWGEDETGQAYMYPTIMNPGNEAIKVPNQYADYISSIGYKKATGIPYAHGGPTKSLVQPPVLLDDNIIYPTDNPYMPGVNKDILDSEYDSYMRWREGFINNQGMTPEEYYQTYPSRQEYDRQNFDLANFYKGVSLAQGGPTDGKDDPFKSTLNQGVTVAKPAQDWVSSWVQDPEFANRLNKNFPDHASKLSKKIYGNKEAKQRAAESNLKSINKAIPGVISDIYDTKFLYNTNPENNSQLLDLYRASYNDPEYDKFFKKTMSKNPQGFTDEQGRIVITNAANDQYGPESVSVHELMHKTGLYDNETFDRTFKGKFLTPSQDRLDKDFNRGEMYPFLMQMRFDNNFQPGEIITPERLKQIKESGYKNHLFKYYTDDEISKYLNTLASNQTQTPMQYAAQGGYVDGDKDKNKKNKNKTRVYTNPSEFKKAERAYNDSLSLYNVSNNKLKEYKDFGEEFEFEKYEGAPEMIRGDDPLMEYWHGKNGIKPFQIAYDSNHFSKVKGAAVMPIFKKPEIKPILGKPEIELLPSKPYKGEEVGPGIIATPPNVDFGKPNLDNFFEGTYEKYRRSPYEDPMYRVWISGQEQQIVPELEFKKLSDQYLLKDLEAPDPGGNLYDKPKATGGYIYSDGGDKDKSSKTTYDYFKKWYEGRAKNPKFTDVANSRLNLLNSPNQYPKVNILPSNQMTTEGLYTPSKNTIDYSDTDLNNRYYGDINTLITHENDHWLSNKAPQEFLNISSGFPEEFKNNKKWLSGKDALTQDEEIRARLSVWRQLNNIDPTKDYSPKELRSIINKNLDDENLDSNIKDIYELIKGDAEKLKFLNDSFVSNQTKSQDMLYAANGGLLGGDDDPPKRYYKRDSPEYKDYLVRLRLNQFSKLPYYQKEYLLNSDENFYNIFSNVDKLGTISDDEWNNSINVKVPNYYASPLDDGSYPNLTEDPITGAYGSPVTYSYTTEIPEHHYGETSNWSQYRYDDLDNPWNYNNLFKKYKPSKYHNQTSWEAEPLDNAYATTYLPKAPWKKNFTKEIEDDTNLIELQKYYPNLTKEELLDMVTHRRNHPTYITNRKDETNHWIEQITDVETYGIDKEHDINWHLKRGEYYPESIVNDPDQYTYPIPYWDEPAIKLATLDEIPNLQSIPFKGFESKEEPLKLSPIQLKFPSKVLLREMSPSLKKGTIDGVDRGTPELYMDDGQGWRAIDWNQYNMYKDMYPGADTEKGWIKNNQKATGGYMYDGGGPTGGNNKDGNKNNSVTLYRKKFWDPKQNKMINYVGSENNEYYMMPGDEMLQRTLPELEYIEDTGLYNPDIVGPTAPRFIPSETGWIQNPNYQPPASGRAEPTMGPIEAALFAPVAGAIASKTVPAVASTLQLPAVVGGRTIPWLTGNNILGLTGGISGANMLGSDINSGYYSSNAPWDEKLARGLETGLFLSGSPGVIGGLGMGLNTAKTGYRNYFKNNFSVNPNIPINPLQKPSLADKRNFALWQANEDAATFSQSPYNRKKLSLFRTNNEFNLSNQKARFANDPELVEPFNRFRDFENAKEPDPFKQVADNPRLYLEDKSGNISQGKYGIRDIGDKDDIIVIDPHLSPEDTYLTGIHETAHSRTLRDLSTLPTVHERKILDDAWSKGLKNQDGTYVYKNHDAAHYEAEAVQNELRMILNDKDGSRVYYPKDDEDIKNALQYLINQKHPYVQSVNDFDISKIRKSLNKIGFAGTTGVVIGTTMKQNLQPEQQSQGGYMNPYMYYAGVPMQYKRGGVLEDIGKLGLNFIASPFEQISGNNFVNFNYNNKGFANAAAVMEGVAGLGTDVAGSIFLGPAYGMGKGAIQGVTKNLGHSQEYQRGADKWANKTGQIASSAGNLTSGIISGNPQQIVSGAGQVLGTLGSEFGSKELNAAGQLVGIGSRFVNPSQGMPSTTPSVDSSINNFQNPAMYPDQMLNQGLSFAATGGNINNNSLNLQNSMRDKYKNYRTRYSKGGTTLEKYGINLIPKSSGLHHENAYGGVPIGPNAMAEGGEYVLDDSYVVSDEVNGQNTQTDEFGRTMAENLKKRLDKYTLRDLSKYKDNLRRPMDPLVEETIEQIKQRAIKETELARAEAKAKEEQRQAMVNGALQYAAAGGKLNKDITKIVEEEYAAAYGGYINPKKYKGLNMPGYSKGGKLPKEILRARVESHMSPQEADAYVNQYGEGGGIHIKESKRGTFTAAATKHGKSVQEFARQVLANKENYSSAMVKKANFARNAASWKHAHGGPMVSNVAQPFQVVAQNRGGMMMAQGGNMYSNGGPPYDLPGMADMDASEYNNINNYLTNLDTPNVIDAQGNATSILDRQKNTNPNPMNNFLNTIRSYLSARDYLKQRGFRIGNRSTTNNQQPNINPINQPSPFLPEHLRPVEQIPGPYSPSRVSNTSNTSNTSGFIPPMVSANKKAGPESIDLETFEFDKSGNIINNSSAEPITENIDAPVNKNIPSELGQPLTGSTSMLDWGYEGVNLDGDPVSINPNMISQYEEGWRPEGASIPKVNQPNQPNQGLTGLDYASMAAQAAGPLSQLYYGLKGPDDVNYERIKADKIDPYRAIILANKQSRQAQDLAGYNLRQSAPTSGSYMSNMRGLGLQAANQRGAQTAGIQYEADVANTQMQNQVNAQNAQIAMQEQIDRQQEKDAARTNVTEGLSGVGSSTANMIRDYRINQVNKTIANNIGTGNFKLVPDGQGGFKFVPNTEGGTFTPTPYNDPYKQNAPAANTGANTPAANANVPSANVTPADKVNNNEWINQILDYESTKGSAGGTGLENYGIKKEKWSKKYPEMWKDNKIDKDEATEFITKEYLPQVKDYPVDVQKRLVDYKYNTGRNIEDVLLLAAGFTTLNDVQTKATDEKLFKEKEAEIKALMNDPAFVQKIDKAKQDILSDYWKRKGTPDVYKNTSEGRINMWNK